MCCMCRNAVVQYRASPHYLAYNPAENAILLCSVSLHTLHMKDSYGTRVWFYIPGLTISQQNLQTLAFLSELMF